MAERALQEEQRQRNMEKSKKQEYSETLRKDVEARSKMRELDHIMQQQQQIENMHMMNSNTQKEISREMAYKNKFSQFEQDMKRKLDWYQQHVTGPKERQARLDSER